MLTGPSDPRLRRYRPLLALAAGLLIALVATSGAIALAERDSERSAKNCSGSSPDATASSTAATSASMRDEAEAASTADASAAANDDGASTGLDLEVRIGRIRVEFPWLKTLPITPGRHVVFTLLPSFDSESR